MADGLALWNAPVSTCSQKVRLILAEKGLPWEDRRIRFDANEHLSDWYLAVNPNGVVPTLVHDTTVVPDSSVIGEYLEDAFPDAPALRPRDPAGAARVRAWRQFIDEVPTTAIRPPSFNFAFVRIWGSLSDAAFDAHVARLPLRRHFYARMGRHGFSEADITEAKERLALTLDRMERALADGGRYLCGAYSLADAAVTASIVRMADIGLAAMWDRHPQVAAWFERIQARQSFAAAYYPGSRDITPSC